MSHARRTVTFDIKKKTADCVVLEDARRNSKEYSQDMAKVIAVEEIDTNLYMSKELWVPLGSRGAFGGQVVAQALNSAWCTVGDQFRIHSLHSYFILPCNADIPVIYKVQRLRDGKTFATRSVTAVQRGKPIFIASFSFATPEQGIRLVHQAPMPDVEKPEDVPSEIERVREWLNADDLPTAFRQYLEKRLEDVTPIEYREVHTHSTEEMLKGTVEPSAVQRRWFKSYNKLDSDDAKLHACSIAYASDSGLIITAARANGYVYDAMGMVVSLDHSIWFHTPARIDEWLLYDMHSPRTSEGRGIAFGKIYSRDGTLVATTAQEGLVRLSEKGQILEKQKTDNENDPANASKL
ncbi:thioesterase-like superfamily-domain-containing protein [Phycomyces blakesleeanus]